MRTEAKRGERAASYRGLNPVARLRQFDENLERLWTLAERPAQQHKGRAHNDPATLIYAASMLAR